MPPLPIPTAPGASHLPARLYLALLTTLFLLPCIVSIRPAVGAQDDDTRIRDAILQTIDSRTAISPGQMEIQVKDGIAVLSGSVANLLQKTQAVEIAESIKGVRSVVDTITVQAAAREDEAIRRDVRRSIVLTLKGRGEKIDAAVQKGVVVLTGVVDSWAISRLADHQAMAVLGVSEVDNRIHVKTQLQREDAHIRADVRERLAADLYVDGRQVETAVTDGRVTLAGVVGTIVEKRRAAEDAWVAGVVAVDAGDVVVDWRERDRMRRDSPYERQSDEAILKAVRDALLMDPRINAYNPDVSVENGVVTLTGIVDTLYAKQAAEADALQTAGVWRVDNQLDLGYRGLPTDQEMLRAIADVFQRDAELHDQEIGVMVDDIRVTLTGTVATMGQKVRAENLASQIEGVLALDNRIVVKGGNDPERPSDVEISERIASQFFWSPYVDGDRIEVAVEDGQALLKGTAANRFVAYIAVENAFQGGAEKVRAELILDNGRTLDDYFTKETFRYRPAGSLFSILP